MQAIILAAGESSRFWPLNQKHKSLIKIMGRPLIWYTIEGLKKAGIKEIIIVQDFNKEIEAELKNYHFDIDVKFVTQDESKGMGDAILCVEKLIKGYFLVVDPYHFEIGEVLKETLTKFELKKDSIEMILFGIETDKPWDYGVFRVKTINNFNYAGGIVEKPAKGQEPSNVRVVGIYILPLDFFDYLKKVPPRHYSLEDALNLYIAENNNENGRPNLTIVQLLNMKTPSLKYPWHLFEFNRDLMDNYLKKQISHSALISKSAVIEGNVFVGENTRILENAVIMGPCYIGENCVVGSNSLVREYVNLEDNVVVGALAEVARCIFQESVHIHSGYFGDSIIGKGCRAGAGVVTANVRFDKKEVKSIVKGEKIMTGLNSFGAVLGDNAKIGVNASLMPGVLLGSDCVVGPASLVSENIESKTFFYSNFEGIKKSAKGI